MHTQYLHGVPRLSFEIGKVLSTRHISALLGARWLIRPGTDVKLTRLGAKWLNNQAQMSSIGAYSVLPQCAQFYHQFLLKR